MLMSIEISKKVWLYLTVLGVTVILLLSIMAGLSRGQALAQSQVVLTNAQSMVKGLKFFYQDQNRYPTALELQDRNLMLNYLSFFPPQEFPSSSCPQSFVYKRPALNSFQLNFCLNTGVGGFPTGWSSFTQASPL